MEFSLVSTIFNEAKRLKQTISDLKSQTLQPTEIIITDAGSTDHTLDILNEWKETSDVPIIILQKKGCNVAEGRNIAIRTAKYELIASTDFGCRFNPRWLESIITPFKNDDKIKVVGGAFNIIESDQLTKAAKAAYLMTNGYKIDVKSMNFIPSSRSIAYKKEVFNQIGGYCEWLTLAGDDMVFGLCIRALKIDILIIEEANVSWGRHQVAKAYVKEAIRYGLGEGEARIHFREFIKNIIVLSAIALFCLTIVANIISLLFFKKLEVSLLIISLVSLVGFKSIFNISKYWINIKSDKYDFSVLLFSFYLQQAVKYGYAKGYLKGRFFSDSNKKNNAFILHKNFNI